MLSVEIKVNGTLVAGFNALNTSGGTLSNYDFSGFAFPISDDYRSHPATFDGEITDFPRKDGILKLVQLMLEEINS